MKLPPPPCAVLLVYCINSGYKYVVSDRSAHFFDKSRLSRPPEAPIFGKISRFSQNPEAPIFRKICHFRKFLNRQISVKIRGFVRNFRKIWDFWHNYMMYWINSGYKCRVSDRGAHFLDRRPFYVIIFFNNSWVLVRKYIHWRDIIPIYILFQSKIYLAPPDLSTNIFQGFLFTKNIK